MDRRRFLLTSVAGALAVPLVAETRHAAKARLGLLTGGSEAGSRTRVEAFRSGLRDLGDVEGQSIALEYRYGNDNYDRRPALVSITDDMNAVVLDHQPHGQLVGDATEPLPKGYQVTIWCPCRAVFVRWVSPEDAAIVLAALARLN